MTIQYSPSSTALVQSQQNNAQPVNPQRTLGSSQSTTTQTTNLTEQSDVTIQLTESARPVEASAPAQSLSPEQAANNILQFIAARLVELKSSGANQQQLQQSLIQAQQGFEQGLAESREILSALGKLEGEQEDRLEQISAQFNNGLKNIRENLFADKPETTAPKPALQFQDRIDIQLKQSEYSQSRRQAAALTNFGQSRANNSSNQAFAASFQEYRSAFARQDSIVLDLRTQDGDRVSIQFSASQGRVFAGNSASLSAGNRIQADFLREFRQEFSQSQLNIGVQGVLDEDELLALESLLDQLSEVATAFFSGEDSDALSRALSLEVDGSEIAQFSADFQSREIQQQTSLYREVAKFDREAPNNRSNPLLQQIRDFIDTQSKVNFTSRSETSKSFFEQLLAITFAAAENDKKLAGVEQANDIKNDLAIPPSATTA